MKASTETDSNYNSKISNFCTKFTANDSGGGGGGGGSSHIGHASNSTENKHSNSSNKFSSNSGKATNVMENCANAIGNNFTKTDSSYTQSETTSSAKGGSNTKSESSGQNPFNTITQRLSNFNFVNDKKSSSSHSHKKTFTFSKSTGNHTGFLHNSNNSSNNSSGNNKNGSDLNNDSGSSLKNSKNLTTGVVPSYDPMKLIGSAACPRFDECPLLEPLVCKKIAHERLTALIFREDCFLTACQDGFIYTWARPGFSVRIFALDYFTCILQFRKSNHFNKISTIFTEYSATQYVEQSNRSYRWNSCLRTKQLVPTKCERLRN